MSQRKIDSRHVQGPHLVERLDKAAPRWGWTLTGGLEWTMSVTTLTSKNDARVWGVFFGPDHSYIDPKTSSTHLTCNWEEYVPEWCWIMLEVLSLQQSSHQVIHWPVLQIFSLSSQKFSMENVIPLCCENTVNTKLAQCTRALFGCPVLFKAVRKAA